MSQGDIDHHTGLDMAAQGLAVIDAGHYGTEYIFMDAMKKVLEDRFPELKVSCARVCRPYTLICGNDHHSVFRFAQDMILAGRY